MKDFFISYTTRDNSESWATWIASILENSGYTTILQAWDFNVGDSFIEKMDYALKNTKRFIAIISKEYLDSPYCKAEWLSAYAKDRHFEKGVFIPIRIEDITPTGIFENIVTIDLFSLDEDSCKEKLLNSIALSNITNITGSVGTKRMNFPGSMPFNNLTYPRNLYFTGRTDKLHNIYDTFFEKTDNLSKRQAITGLGGVGKTAIALEYAYRYSVKYDTIWWITADNQNNILKSFREFALDKKLITKFSESEEILRAVSNWFLTNEKWLFIYDNADADDYEQWLKDYLPQGNNGHTLITTRNYFFPHCKTTDIQIFDTEESISFLFNRTKMTGDGYSDDIAIDLAKRLQFLPLALEQAAAYIEQTQNVTYQDYIDIFKEKGIDVFDTDNYLVDYSSIINLTWQISMEKITDLSAKQMFYMCSYFAPDNIPVYLFVNGNTILPNPLVYSISDDIKRNEIIKNLSRYSLISVSRLNNLDSNEKRVLSMHRLVQEVVQKKIGDSAIWIGCCLDLILSVFDWKSHGKTLNDIFKYELPHVVQISEKADEVFKGNFRKNYHISEIYFGVGLMYAKTLYMYQAEKYIEKSIEKLELLLVEANSNNFSNDHKDEIIIYLQNGLCAACNNIGITYFHNRSFEKAILYYDRSIHIGEELLNEKKLKLHEVLILAFMNRAILFTSLKNLEKALSDINKSIEMYEHFLREGSIDDENYLAKSLSNRVAIYQKLNRYEEASADVNKAIFIWESMKKENKQFDENELKTAYLNKAINDTKMKLSDKNINASFLKKGSQDLSKRKGNVNALLNLNKIMKSTEGDNNE